MPASKGRTLKKSGCPLVVSVLAALLLSSWVLVSAQESDPSDLESYSFPLQSIEGDSFIVEVYGNPIGENRLYTKLATQLICIDEYRSVDSSRVLQGTFLVLHYSERCGTGCGLSGLALMCIFEGRLQFAAPITVSRYHEYFPSDSCEFDSLGEPAFDKNVWLCSYDVESVDNSYRLRQITNHRFVSPCAPDTNETDTAQILFDRTYGVFCARIDTLSGKFQSLKNEVNVWENRTTRSNVPAAVFQFDSTYAPIYFIDGKWWRPEVGTYFRQERGECPD